MIFRHGPVDSDNESNRDTRSRIYSEIRKPRGKTFSMQPKMVSFIHDMSKSWLNLRLIADATWNELLMHCEVRLGKRSWLFREKNLTWIINVLRDGCCSYCAQLSFMISINVNMSSLLLNRQKAMSNPCPTTHAKTSQHCFLEPVKKVSNTPMKNYSFVMLSYFLLSKRLFFFSL